MYNVWASNLWRFPCFIFFFMYNIHKKNYNTYQYCRCCIIYFKLVVNNNCIILIYLYYVFIFDGHILWVLSKISDMLLTTYLVLLSYTIIISIITSSTTNRRCFSCSSVYNLSFIYFRNFNYLVPTYLSCTYWFINI